MYTYFMWIFVNKSFTVFVIFTLRVGTKVIRSPSYLSAKIEIRMNELILKLNIKYLDTIKFTPKLYLIHVF